MSEKDIKVTFEPKMTQQILKTLPGDIRNQIVFAPVMVNNINQQGGEDGSRSELYPNPFRRDSELPFNFEMFLESLDPPKLKTLIDMAIQVAIKKNGTRMAAERWLGGEGLLNNYRLEHKKRQVGRYAYNCDKETLVEVLRKHKWNRTQAGNELGIPLASIGRLIKRHQIKEEENW
jgi:hypothetical protein